MLAKHVLSQPVAFAGPFFVGELCSTSQWALALSAVPMGIASALAARVWIPGCTAAIYPAFRPGGMGIQATFKPSV